jgi:hypothetical protein
MWKLLFGNTNYQILLEIDGNTGDGLDRHRALRNCPSLRGLDYHGLVLDPWRVGLESAED